LILAARCIAPSIHTYIHMHTYIYTQTHACTCVPFSCTYSLLPTHPADYSDRTCLSARLRNYKLPRGEYCCPSLSLPSTKAAIRFYAPSREGSRTCYCTSPFQPATITLGVRPTQRLSPVLIPKAEYPPQYLHLNHMLHSNHLVILPLSRRSRTRHVRKKRNAQLASPPGTGARCHPGTTPPIL
jgi:hypothetical protein